jgi:two-component sensor histidine kinase
MKKYVLLFVLLLIGKIAFLQSITALVNSLKTDKAKADTLMYFSMEAAKKMRYDSAMYWLSEGNNYAVKTPDKKLIALYQLQKAGLYSMAGKHRLSLEEANKLDAFVATNQSYHINIRTLMTKGQAYALLGKKDSALFFFLKAETCNKTHKQAPTISNWYVYVSLADLFNRAKDFNQAEKYYLQAYEQLKNSKKLNEYGYFLLLINNFYLSWSRADKAGFFLVEHTNYVLEKKKYKTNDPLENIIESVTNGQLESNISYMQKVKESALKNGDVMQAIIANGYIIRHYEKKKKFTEALDIVEANVQLSQQANDLQSLYFSKQNKYQLLQNLEKYKEATQLAEELFVLKDSLLAIEGSDRLYELEKKYHSQKKEKEIEILSYQNNLNDKEIALLTSDKKLAAIYLQQELLKRDALTRENILMDSIVQKEQINNKLLTSENALKTSELSKESSLKAALARENELKAKELTQQRQIKGGLIAGLSLLLLSGIAIFSMYYKQKNKNAIIQKQASDLEVLMKEIHHRVKNNLQVVSSLLDLQSHTISDVQAYEAVKEGKNRVQSMALIHQNLYSEGNIKGIRLKEYVYNLINTLTHSYNISNEHVKITMQLDDLNLDVDTMIPLGLVLNELVSNAFKYAFKSTTTGQLQVQIEEIAEQLYLKVSDNGIGFPVGLDIKNGKSFGLKMIRAFAQKLKAKLDIYNNNGAVVEMKITKYKMA